MSSSQKPSTPKAPPLKRWKGRLHIFNKPTFWVSTAVLLLIGLLLADYSRVQLNNADIETQLELARLEGEEGDRQSQSDGPDYDDSHTATLDGIPLPEDPEQREWALREANDLNADEIEEASRLALEEAQQNAEVANSDNNADEFQLNEPARLVTNEDNKATDQDNDGSLDARTRRSRRDRQEEQPDSAWDRNTSSANDVLELMGLTAPRTQGNGAVSSGETPSDGSGSFDLFSSNNAEVLPASALAQALQNLSITPGTASPSVSSGTAERLTTPISPQNPALAPGALPGATLEGIPTFQPPSIQTAPQPGTTGYIVPPPLPNASLPATGTPSAIGSSVPSIGAVSPSTSLAPQPTVSLPQVAAPPVLPTPVFTTPTTVDHTPYTGGGRNGSINTFSNP